ncbi:MAG: NUDIX hydrolase [Acidimicrobiia bacterium]|nr:NUDIX hydrolase [Acidimicrobiia bacterium]
MPSSSAGRTCSAGGAVDPADREAPRHPAAAGVTDADASARLALHTGGLAYWVAAVREAFEEAGVLLARDDDGRSPPLVEPTVARRFADHRRAVDVASATLWDVCGAEGLELALDQLLYVSHWITPEGAPRRYDTRFFLAALPEGQEPTHDDREVVSTVWTAPDEALGRADRGEWELILPTVRNLELLARFADTATALDAVATAQSRTPVAIPETGGQSRVRLADDPPAADPDDDRPLVPAGGMP